MVHLKEIIAKIEQDEVIRGYLVKKGTHIEYIERYTLEKSVSWGNYKGYNVVDGKVVRTSNTLGDLLNSKKEVCGFDRKIPTIDYASYTDGLLTMSVVRYMKSGGTYYIDATLFAKDEVSILNAYEVLKTVEGCYIYATEDYTMGIKLSIDTLLKLRLQYVMNVQTVREYLYEDISEEDGMFITGLSTWCSNHNIEADILREKSTG